jgi:hypothetical protein
MTGAGAASPGILVVCAPHGAWYRIPIDHRAGDRMSEDEVAGAKAQVAGVDTQGFTQYRGSTLDTCATMPRTKGAGGGFWGCMDGATFLR